MGVMHVYELLHMEGEVQVGVQEQDSKSDPHDTGDSKSSRGDACASLCDKQTSAAYEHHNCDVTWCSSTGQGDSVLSQGRQYSRGKTWNDLRWIGREAGGQGHHRRSQSGRGEQLAQTLGRIRCNGCHKPLERYRILMED